MSTSAVPILYNTATQRLNPIRDIRELLQYWNLIANLVQRDLTVRYKRSVFGFLWTMLNPLLLMIILTVVFSSVFRFEGIEHYPIYFLSEYLVFGFFAQTTVQSMTTLAWHGSLMKRVRVPKSIFAVSTTLSGLVNLCLAYIPLFLIMLLTGSPVGWAVLFLPVALLIIAAFTLGISLMLSALAIYFEDVSHMYQVATVGLMYMTPIIYPISIVPYKWLWVIRVNPLTHLFKLARDPIYQCSLPGLHVVGASVASAVVALVVGWVVFHRLARGFYLHL
ncbi:MAG TPA: ABC transporter permease [Thermoanaerobaculales bacterium]|nr:ABC transporter permease [Thermoanaerobaculales bacterium]HPA82892.1 ABC transporter permease [Thermoanaerobaculales bacterium]HQN94895.1 ABC transporter permease [Thermoanaerobaculales bacterium]HQP43660.1 ABC transporter permease [Thermoanaerobaculales bacterium]